MFFRSVALLTTLACAATSFAAPVAQAEGLVPLPAIPALPIPAVPVAARQFGGLLGGVGLPAAAAERRQLDVGTLPDLTSLTARDEAQVTAPDAFQNACNQVATIVVKIQAALNVTAGAKVDVKVVVSLLLDIVVALRVLIADLTVVVAHVSGSVVLTLGGVVITVKQLAVIVVSLLHVVVSVVAVVVRTLTITVSADLHAVVLQIGVLLAQVLVLVIKLVPSILAEITIIIGPVVGDLCFLNYTDIIAVLKIAVSAYGY